MKAFGKNLGEGTMLLPSGSTFKNTIKSFLDANTTLTKIKFIDNSTTTSSHILETDEDGTVAYMVANGEWLEIHTSGRKFIANENCNSMFSLLEQIMEIDFENNFDTSNVETMSFMFFSCKSLTTLDVSCFNTSKVTDMQWMFSHCSNLKNLDLSMFDTYNVKNMWEMFNSCSNLEYLNIKNFNTSNVTNMKGMFYSCPKLKSLDLSSFTFLNSPEVTSMLYIDYAASISVKVNKAGHIYLTETKTDHKLPSTSKFVKPDGSDW